jgi:hypothetical protein
MNLCLAGFLGNTLQYIKFLRLLKMRPLQLGILMFTGVLTTFVKDLKKEHALEAHMVVRR